MFYRWKRRYDEHGEAGLADRLRLEQSVLITPGPHFGIGKYLRIGYGYRKLPPI